MHECNLKPISDCNLKPNPLSFEVAHDSPKTLCRLPLHQKQIWIFLKEKKQVWIAPTSTGRKKQKLTGNADRVGYPHPETVIKYRFSLFLTFSDFPSPLQRDAIENTTFTLHYCVLLLRFTMKLKCIIIVIIVLKPNSLIRYLQRWFKNTRVSEVCHAISFRLQHYGMYHLGGK